MRDTILVIGDQDAQTKLLKNISDSYAIKPFGLNSTPNQPIRGTINLEIGTIKGEQNLQVIAVPNDAEYVLSQFVERSIGCIGVVNGRALTNQVTNAISMLEELSIQYSKPCIVVTMDRKDQSTNQSLHSALGINDSIPVIHCKSDAIETNFKAIDTLSTLISQEEFRTNQIKSIVADVIEHHGEIIQGMAIFAHNGTLHGSHFAENGINDQIGFRFAALMNMCQQMLSVSGMNELNELVITGETYTLMMYSVYDYMMVFQIPSQKNSMLFAREIACDASAALEQINMLSAVQTFAYAN